MTKEDKAAPKPSIIKRVLKRIVAISAIVSIGAVAAILVFLMTGGVQINEQGWLSVKVNSVLAAGEPTYQEVAEGKTTGGTTVDVDVSGFTLSAGDLLVGILSTDGKDETHTSPDSDTWNDILVSITEGTNNTLSAWWKTATGSETTLTFGGGSTEAMYAMVLRITGHNASTPIDSNTTSGTGDSTSATCPDITTQYNSELILRVFGADHGDVTVDGGWAAVTNISVDESGTGNGDCSGGVGWENKATAGSVGTEVNTLTSTEEWVAFTIGIRPAAGVSSISNAPSTYDFGIVAVSSTTSTGLAYFTVTNNSGAAVDITIKGTDMTGGTAWTLSDTATPGVDICGLYAGLSGGSYNIIVKKNATYNTLVAGLADTDTQDWGLQLLAPTEFADGAAKQGTVTLMSVLS